MRLEEMGVIGRQAKIADTAPSHAGEVGRIISATTERVYIQFANGDKEWFANKHIVGTRKTESFEDYTEYPLTEMAAKKQCEKCGKTMAANHYWYKGGWKCKGAKTAGQAPAASAPAAPKPAAAKPAAQPAAPTPSKITIDEVKKLVPELGREIYGDMLHWQVTEYNGTISVHWDYTFRRNTREGAYMENRQRIMAANDRIEMIAAKYKANVTRMHLATRETARQGDEWQEGNGESAYSEYEQAIGGGVDLKVV